MAAMHYTTKRKAVVHSVLLTVTEFKNRSGNKTYTITMKVPEGFLSQPEYDLELSERLKIKIIQDLEKHGLFKDMD